MDRNAVDGLSLNFYEGQITAFLGHNGAGKTTTMALLTGLYQPSSGTAEVYGFDIRSDMAEIRRSLALCPQYNVLFDELNVLEHLMFYAALRGVWGRKARDDSRQLLRTVGLLDREDSPARHLSGGMKRKLSLVVAFAGGCRTVLLDEPTAGVDPWARRNIWEMLYSLKTGRTIILTTHHMDEADVLGDRIAIVNDGRLRCCGSSLFLKSLFGNHYYLVIVKDMASLSGATESSASSSGLGSTTTGTLNEGTVLGGKHSSWNERFAAQLDSTVASFVPDSEVTDDTSQERIYKLPSASIGHFSELFQHLETTIRTPQTLGVASFGVSHISLEEIFIHATLGTQATDLDDDEAIELERDRFSCGGNEPRPVTWLSLRSTKGTAHSAAKKTVLRRIRERTGELSLPSFLRKGRRQDGWSKPILADTGVKLERVKAFNSDLPNTDQPYVPDSLNSLKVVVHNDDDNSSGQPSPANPPLSNGLHTTNASVEGVEDEGSSDSAVAQSSSGTAADATAVAVVDEQQLFHAASMASISGVKQPTFGHRLEQLWALYVKRFHHTKRSVSGLIFEVLIPSIFVAGAVLLIKLFIYKAVQPSLEVHPWLLLPKDYPIQLYPFISLPHPSPDWAPNPDRNAVNRLFAFANQAAKKTGWAWGNRCINRSVHEIHHFRDGDNSGLASFQCPLAEGLDTDKMESSIDFLHRAVRNYWIDLRKSISGTYKITNSSDLEQCFCKCGPNGLNIAKDVGYNWSATFLSPSCFDKNVLSLQCPGHFSLLQPSVTHITGDRLVDLAEKSILDFMRKAIVSGKVEKRAYGGIQFMSNMTSFGPASVLPADAFRKFQINPLSDDYRLPDAAEKSFYKLLEQLNITQQLNLTQQSIRKLVNRDLVRVWYNNKGHPSSTAYSNLANNLLLRGYLTEKRSILKPWNTGFAVYSHPMEKSMDELMDQLSNNLREGFFYGVTLILALSFIPSSFLIYLIQERHSNFKHLQFVGGVSRITYWTANFTWDVMKFSLSLILVLIIFIVLDVRLYVTGENLGAFTLMLFLYGLSATPLTYPFSYVFNVPSTGFVFLSALHLSIGIIASLTVYTLEQISRTDPEYEPTAELLSEIFVPFPQFCLGYGLIKMGQNQLLQDVGLRTDSVYSFQLLGRLILSMCINCVCWLVVTLALEYHHYYGRLVLACFGGQVRESMRCNRPEEAMDSDVATESDRVKSGNIPDDSILVIDQLSKVYLSTRKMKQTSNDDDKSWKGPRFVGVPAVNRICTAIARGECFGLLGVNGAGKTTTFKMLTGELLPTDGDARVMGNSIRRQLELVQQNVGYCPQFDALDPLLSGRELLTFYAAVKGIPVKDPDGRSLRANVVEDAIVGLQLTELADRPCGQYSGGNKRKLQTALALLGAPALLLLDEPTAGMDPGARRFLWRCIRHHVQLGRTVLLTSHNMDECEALCSRLSIMVNGVFRCLGSVQHLKNRYGRGYLIKLRLSQPCARISNDSNDNDSGWVSVEKAERNGIREKVRISSDAFQVLEAVRQVFADTELQECHVSLLELSVGKSDNAGGSFLLSQLFSLLERRKAELKIRDYSVTQTTLDLVFIRFAQEQYDC